MHDVPSPKDVLSLALLDSCGFKGLIDERPFLEILQGVTSQHPMRCKEEHLLWDNGSLHWEDAKGEKDWGHPYLDRGEWMESKRLVSHL